MKIVYNDNIYDQELHVDPLDRGLSFGDGLFETISIKNKEPRYLQFHLDRLHKGAKTLQLDLPSILSISALKETITNLVSVNGQVNASLKLVVWRKKSVDTGYGFSSTECNYMLISRAADFKNHRVDKVDFAEKIAFHYSPYSAYKTLNALPYVLAANERQQRGLDEMIVLNNEGFICECVASNIFWKAGERFFTPPVSGGCVNGVIRRVVIERLNQKGLSISENSIRPDNLLQADAVFATNSSGIRFFKKIRNVKMDTSLFNNPLFSL